MIRSKAILKEALESIESIFDYIIIDCPPSLGLLTLNALTAAHKLLIPTQTEFLALRRLAAILQTVGLVRRRLNKELQLLGILPTMYDSRTLHARDVLKEINKIIKIDCIVFDPIPRSVRFADATIAGLPIIEYSPNFEGSQIYKKLAEDVDK